MKKSKIALILLIASFIVWIFQLYEANTASDWESIIGPTIQFILMIAFYFAIKKGK